MSKKNFMKPHITILCILFLTITGCSDNAGQQEQQPASPGETRTSQAQQKQRPAFQSIDPAAAKILLDSRDDLLLIDVRTPPELKQGSIKGSTLISFWDVARGQANLPRDKAIMLVCAVGGRSYAAGRILARNGYKEVYNLSGGISAWEKAKLPLEH